MSIRPDISDIGAPFWQGLRERRLLLQCDAASGRAQFYPRPQSLYGEAGVQWREASGQGRILALTLSRVGPPGLESLVPYALALVQLQEGPRLLARISAAYESLRPGMAVQIDWDGAGNEPAFPVFRPAGNAAGNS
jgi:uncharacterized OB-fold protein